MKYDLFLMGFILYFSALVFGQVWAGQGYVHQGVRVVGLMPGSPALFAGLQEHDVLLAFDAIPVRTAEDFIAVLKQKQSGELVVVSTVRGVIPVVLGTDPISGNARFGTYVETIQTPRISLFFAFTLEKLLTLTYVVGLACILGGTALFLQKTSLFIEGATLNVLNVLDIITTRFFLNKGHVEGNPVGQFLLEQVGFGQTALIKFVLVFAASLALMWMTHHPSLRKKSLAHSLIAKHHLHLKGSVLAYAFVVLVNVGVLF